MAFEPSWLQQQLGDELHKARQARDLSARDVGEALDWAHTKVTRIERAEVKTTTADVISLANLYQMPDREADRLCAMARQSRTNTWWKPYRRWISEEYYQLIGYENDASRMQSLHTTVINGMLQTREYSMGVFEASATVADPDHIEALVEVRGLRQRRLFESKPLVIDVTMDESVLDIPYGGQDVLTAQLRHLKQMAEHPNITIRILPTRVATERVPVTVYEFGSGEGPAISTVDGTFSIIIQDDPLDVRAARRVLQATQAKALSPEASTELISKKIKESI
jgi:transcriptional regulator with XRE-family HTH domain